MYVCYFEKILDSETDFKAYCRNYIIKVDKKSDDDMKEIVVGDFSVFSVSMITV